MEKQQQTVQEKYNTFLSGLLEQKLFESAMELNATLVKTFNVTPQYARKILERAVAQNAIKSSAPYTFGKGQYVYIYNEHDFGKDGIKRIAEKSRPPIYRLLELMDQNRGIISYYEALKITAAPLEKSSTKVNSLDDILTLLMKLDIVHKIKDRNDLVYIVYKIYKDKEATLEIMMADHFAGMVADCSVLPDVLRWLSNANIIDIGNVIYRNKKTPHIGAKHNNLVWDAFAYSRTTGINPILGAKADTVDKKTLVALDVALTTEYSAIHLDAFIGRIQINRKSVNQEDRKILPIIIYRLCSTHTINKIRKNGIIAFDISAIFGTKIYEVLNRFQELSVLLKESDGIEQTIEGILKTINNAGQDEALKELRGTLFEFLMYPLLKTLYPNASIERGKILTIGNKEEKESYEYDYIIESSNPPEIIFVELKGYNSSATINLGDTNKKATLRWFFRKTLPFAEKYYKETIEKGKKAKAVFITSANFFDDGKEFIGKMNASKYKSKLLETGYERQSLLLLLKEYGFEAEIRIIDKFYSGPVYEDEDDNEVRNILSDLEADLL
ncbi:hypothetical protein NYQ10_14855 [Flavobacterium johnsoniae]|uniref:hypothetical protein n=1 Tax=Flavobacterium johnsoniae TaxID=986 RepID=UPI0025B1E8E1|nr:hypothetical protein [Flavobacterium johnsoniae]WJS93371.1 hypothetical protein NYQ10_14855 [Flavobacterium johnsoniae]